MGIDNFIAPLAVIGTAQGVRLNFDTALEPDDVLAYEKRHGRARGVAWSSWWTTDGTRRHLAPRTFEGVPGMLCAIRHGRDRCIGLHC